MYPNLEMLYLCLGASSVNLVGTTVPSFVISKAIRLKARREHNLSDASSMREQLQLSDLPSETKVVDGMCTSFAC